MSYTLEQLNALSPTEISVCSPRHIQSVIESLREQNTDQLLALQAVEADAALMRMLLATCHEMKFSNHRDGTPKSIRAVFNLTCETSKGFRDRLRQDLGRINEAINGKAAQNG